MIAGEQEFRGTDEPHTILKFDIAGQEILPRQLFQLADSIFAERVSGNLAQKRTGQITERGCVSYGNDKRRVATNRNSV